MKSILLLCVWVASIAPCFSRVAVSQNNQREVAINLAKIKAAIIKIEHCLTALTSDYEASDMDLPTDADASASDTDAMSTTNNRSNVGGRLRAKAKPPKISAGSHSSGIVTIKRERSLVSHPVVETQEPEPQLNSIDVDALVKSIYSKAINDINATAPMELMDDQDSLPEVATLSLRIQSIFDPQKVIYDELATRSLQAGFSTALHKKLSIAEEHNKELIQTYNRVIKGPRGKKYIERLKNTMVALKVKTSELVSKLLYAENSENKLVLTTFGVNLINSLSKHLQKNGIFRQYGVSKKGEPITLKTEIESESPQDSAIILMIHLLSDMVLHQFDISSSGLSFDKSILTQAKIMLTDDIHQIYLMQRDKSITGAQYNEDTDSFEADEQSIAHQLTNSEERLLETIIITMVKNALRDSKLRSNVFGPLMSAIKLKPDIQTEETE
ncbi:MAG: hypothetical protein C0446_14440 [Chitinophaga sp.]|nr:hypothetical protein [Chitinophaga sp.]